MIANGEQSRGITTTFFQYLILLNAVSFSLSYLWPDILLKGHIHNSPSGYTQPLNKIVTSYGCRNGRDLSLSLSSQSRGNRDNAHSQRRKPRDNRVAIQWVFESVEKVLKEEKTNSGRTGIKMKSNSRDQLLLMEALSQIRHARSKSEVTEAGDTIASLDMNRFSYAVQERVMKGVAMAGLLQLSLQILDSMLLPSSIDGQSGTLLQEGCDPVSGLTQPYVPSAMSYITIFKCLRKRKRLEEMREIFHKLKVACKATSTKIDIVALNIYLAALCDVSNKRDKNRTNLARNKKGRKTLSEAIRLLGAGIAQAEFELVEAPGVYAFNTVLNAAASLRNIPMTRE